MWYIQYRSMHTINTNLLRMQCSWSGALSTVDVHGSFNAVMTKNAICFVISLVSVALHLQGHTRLTYNVIEKKCF